MATAITLLPQNNVNHPIVDEKGVLKRQEVQYRSSISNSFQLLLIDTTSGNVAGQLPPANSVPNQEIAAIKTSSDGNTASLAANGTDTINKQGAWGAATLTLGTAQGVKALLKSDGNASWYVIA